MPDSTNLKIPDENSTKERSLFLLPSLPKISCPIEGTATRTDVAFYFIPGANPTIF
jgi:hypothetical protein